MRILLWSLAVLCCVQAASAQVHNVNGIPVDTLRVDRPPLDPPESRASSPLDPASLIPDPLRSRLFFMSSGQLMEPEQFSLETFDLFGLRGTYAFNDFMQVGFTAILPPFQGFPFHASGSAKIRLLGPTGGLAGLALGADFGYFFVRGTPSFRGTLQDMSLSATFGREAASGFVTAVYLPNGIPDSATFGVKYLLQVGASLPIGMTGKDRGLKFITEGWLGGTSIFDAHPTLAAVGLRSYGPAFVAELGAVFGPPCFDNCPDAGEGVVLYLLPYASATVFF
ncbi:MAG: hypothetical protein JWQ98_3237 [Chlorobi bacterium]|nr:hypothetical protein [Chlorobiota bacterium]